MMLDDKGESRTDEAFLEFPVEGISFSKRNRRRSLARPRFMFVGFLVFLAYSIFLVAVTSKFGARQRLYGTRFLGCRFLQMLETELQTQLILK
jgi:hypothetical protein